MKEGRLQLSRGPRENWARPAIDPLFRCVADEYGADAIGVVLTGNLNDGTVGLYEIKRRGGTAVVQDPGEAEAIHAVQRAEQSGGGLLRHAGGVAAPAHAAGKRRENRRA